VKRSEKNGHAAPETEVPLKAQRRKFTAEYKADILKRAEACEPGSGELGELLRTAGLYTSHLSVWRAQRDRGVLDGLEPKKRGRKAKRRDEVALENERLRRENERLQHRLQQAEVIIEVQKKVSTLLGIQLPNVDEKNEENE
jgi:transposase-like protein